MGAERADDFEGMLGGQSVPIQTPMKAMALPQNDDDGDNDATALQLAIKGVGNLEVNTVFAFIINFESMTGAPVQ